jgi:hypothetical protein
MIKKKGKQIKFIVSLISVGIFVISYFIIYERYADRTTDAYNEIEFIRRQMRDREEMLIQEEEVLISLEEVKEQKQEIIDSYPVHIAKEDNFMFVEKLRENLNISIMSLDISDNTSFYKTILPAVEEDIKHDGNQEDTDTQLTTMNGVVNTISMSFLTSYEGLKELSEYIRNYPEPTVIDNVSISYDSSTGALAGNLILKRFALTGTGKEYKGTYIDGIDIGTDNIFGTAGRQTENNDEINEQD